MNGFYSDFSCQFLNEDFRLVPQALISYSIYVILITRSAYCRGTTSFGCISECLTLKNLSWKSTNVLFIDMLPSHHYKCKLIVFITINIKKQDATPIIIYDIKKYFEIISPNNLFLSLTT